MNLLKVYRNLSLKILTIITFLISSSTPINAKDLVLDWYQTTSLPFLVGGASTLTYSNKIFTFNGSAYKSGGHDELLESVATESGNLKAWIYNSKFPEKYIYQDSKNKGNNFYVLGGLWDDIDDKYGSSHFVYRSDYLGTTFSIWSKETNLPKRLSQGKAEIVGEWIYYAGGWTDWPGNLNNIVYKSKINTDGSLGEWITAGIMPSGLSQFSLAAHGNKLYFIGGEESSGVVKTVRSAILDSSSGNVMSWELQPSLPIPSKLHAIITLPKGILLVGGNNSSGNLNKVLFAQFDKNENLTGWIEDESYFPWEIATHSMGILGDYVYVIGGFAVGPGIFGATNAVWKAKLSPEVLADKTPVVLIPGMGASFNKALLHLGTSAPNIDWKLAPYVKNYDSLISSLEDKELYVYNYDWRRPIQDNALELNNFLDEKNIDEVEIIGHSMGGLIGSRFGASSPSALKKLTTLGSPFGGSAKVYRLWEGADLSGFAGYEKIAISLFLEVNAGRFDSDVQTIQKNIPSFLNVLPTTDYLKRENGQVIPVNKMTWRNNFWPYLQPDIQPIASKSANIFGSGIDTEKIFTVKNRSILDQVLGRWEDGKPIEKELGLGDGTVLIENARFQDADWQELENVLHLDLPASQAYPKFEKALVLAIASPAKFEVYKDNVMIGDSEDVFALDEPASGDYTVKIKPIGEGGDFKFYFGRISENDAAWDDFAGQVSTAEAELIFTLNWGSSDLGSNPVQRALGRLEKIKLAMGGASINAGEKQVFEKEILDLGVEILNLPNLDENRQAALIRSALQKVYQVENAWNQSDPGFVKVVQYNLRYLTRDVLEALGNL